ncbi:MAG: T9SS type A sorting domain-containing protein [Bacteroidetes bacterium]|nr:T9SS type A sorting domain-containing protein [Bacteroidota bacterium]
MKLFQTTFTISSYLKIFSYILIFIIFFTLQIFAGHTISWDASTGTITIVLTGPGTYTFGKHPDTGGISLNGVCLGILASDIRMLIIQGSGGDDTIDLRDIKTGDFPLLTPYADYTIGIHGSDGDDIIHGSSDFSNRIYGGEGNDTVEGGGKKDSIHGDGGDDTIFGLDGDDFLDGGDGADVINGGIGNDYIYGRGGSDSLYGGGGNDDINGDVNDSVLGGDAGYDLFAVLFGPGSFSKNDNLLKSDNVLTITDLSGIDTLSFAEYNSEITIDIDLLGSAQAFDSAGNEILLEGVFEIFIGSSFNDEITIDPLVDAARSIDGGAGEDVLNFDGQNADVTDDGTTLATVGFLEVTYINIETLNITNAPNLNPTIEVTSPNGGETWEDGSTHEITWTTTGILDNVKIECTLDNGTTWIVIVENTENDGSYTWVLPDTAAEECMIRVRGVEGSPSDISDAVFIISVSTSIEENESLPSSSKLHQNFPNPFNPSTRISFTLAEDAAGSVNMIKIHNTLGQLIQAVDISGFPQGSHKVIFEGVDMNNNKLPSGIYFILLEVNNRVRSTSKMVLMK